ncbi:hypothetical protein PFISCL1PPCAC_4981 [Pristionchus fissidentatus]|uniref:Ribosomal protein n=1 Tax=Pristionchus fissidentatus TaxID=1538716 RepID=A0AAV5V2P1_9BILA|nr:hypothetical protein PFISCL1PPCAC_4981 [Pristionchus fissidentatus]
MRGYGILRGLGTVVDGYRLVQLAALSGVHLDRLLEIANLLSEQIEVVVELLRVVSLLIHLDLEFGDARKLLLTTFSGCLSVSQSLPLQLFRLLIVHVREAVGKVVGGCGVHYWWVGRVVFAAAAANRGRKETRGKVSGTGHCTKGRGVWRGGGEGWRRGGRRKGWGR